MLPLWVQWKDKDGLHEAIIPGEALEGLTEKERKRVILEWVQNEHGQGTDYSIKAIGWYVRDEKKNKL